MLTTPWIFFYPISFYGRASHFEAFQTEVAPLCVCLPCSHKNAGAHMLYIASDYIS